MTDHPPNVEEIFHAAQRLTPAERAVFLEGACSGDEHVRSDVLSLLSAHDEDKGFLERGPGEVDRPGIEERTLGSYRLVHEIAAGGMGAVWLAERTDGAYQTRVAIKLIHSALTIGSRRAEIVRRFVEERQTLANLDHPNIARLLDGGTTRDGTPYLVLELIEGLPVDRYCREHDLSIEERVRLFQQVCAAVQHAHSRLVAHRDLKPANILVRTNEHGEPEPKLLDFGIAKLLEGAQPSALQRTTLGSALLTPVYASPEQIRGEPCGTASDVFSLGVVLYELLAGRLPFDVEGAPLPVVFHRVCNETPRLAGAVDRRLKGDLETILARTLEREAANRYASVAALSEDLERWRTGHPILARPSTAWERLQKTARRNKLPFALAAGSFLAVSALSLWLALENARSVRAEGLAEKRRDHAERESKLIRGLLAAPDPYRARGRDVKVVDVLNETSPTVLAGLGDQPEMRFELEGLVGETYRNLGDLERARAHLRSSLEAAREQYGQDDEHTFEPLCNLGTLDMQLGRVEDAEASLRAVVAAAERVLGPRNVRTLLFKSNLATVLRETRRPGEAERLMRECYAGRRELLGDSDPETIAALNSIVSLLGDQGRWKESEDLAREGLDAESFLEPRRPEIRLGLQVSLGHALRSEGRLEEGGQILLATAEERRTLLGDTHPDTLQAMLFAADVLLDQGDVERANEWVEHVLDATTRKDEPDRLDRIHARLLKTQVLMMREQYAEAETWALDTVALAAQRLGEGNWMTQNARNELWQIAYARGDLPTAEIRLREVLDILRREGSEQDRDILAGEGNLAVMLQNQDRRVEARLCYEKLIDEYARLGRRETPEAQSARHNLALLLQAEGRLEEAEELLCEIVSELSSAEHAADMSAAWVRASHGRVLAQLGQNDAAEAELLESYAGFRRSLPEGHPRVKRHVTEVADFYASIGRKDRAAEFRALLDPKQ